MLSPSTHNIQPVIMRVSRAFLLSTIDIDLNTNIRLTSFSLFLISSKFIFLSFIFIQGSQLIQMKISAPAETGEESPVTSFVLLERYNAIRLVQIVHASLSSLSKVIRGTALLDAEVQALAGALLKQEVRRRTKSLFSNSLLPGGLCGGERLSNSN